MWSLIGSLASSASGILALLAVIAGIAGGGAYVEHKIDTTKLATVEEGYAKAQAAAVSAAAAIQKQIDDQALAAAQAETTAQAAQTASLQQELSNVPTFVTAKALPCVPYGLVRLFDAAVLGVPASSLALPAGKSNDSCSAITADELSASVLSNYGAANANAEQLNALIALLKKQQTAGKK